VRSSVVVGLGELELLLVTDILGLVGFGEEVEVALVREVGFVVVAWLSI
jgi:hypothetical protein